MIGGQDEGSCGESGIDETPQEQKRRGGSKSCTESNSGVTSDSPSIIYPICSSLD
ncbi:hypothetical protein [Priestia aryabhattai]